MLLVRVLLIGSCVAAIPAVHDAKAQQPDAVTIQRDLSYLEAGREGKLDLYQPATHKSSDRRPAVVILHGGGWVKEIKNANAKSFRAPCWPTLAASRWTI